MSFLNRLLRHFRRERLNRELDEELASHLDDAIAAGRSPEEARRALGSALLHREQSRDVRLFPWLDVLLSDIVFGWRQIRKHSTVSAAAILSLALATGATTSAFRLVDALLFRPLPVAEPERLFSLATTYIDREGRPDERDDFDYPSFVKYRKTVEGKAELMVVGLAARQDISIGANAGEKGKAYRQYVSGNVFGILGLRPALGRLLTPHDDVTPGGHPVAVISHDFWTSRFGGDPNVTSKTFRLGPNTYQIVGVAPQGFTGTEPGVITDLYILAMMNAAAINSPGWSWFRIWARPKPGVTPEQVRQPLQAALLLEHQERAKSFPPSTPKQYIDTYLSEAFVLHPAASGASDLKTNYRRPLFILAVLVLLVLLIACTNVANLLTAQATARVREMAIRVSIGGGRWRLIQLVGIESALLAVIASLAGTLFAWWSAPFVVSMLAPAERPVRLILDIGWRALAFSVALTFAVTVLFGLAPALRASFVKPVNALKDSESPHSRRLLIHTLVSAQVAFCVLVLFVAGLFAATFQRLQSRPLGFSHERVLIMEAANRSKNITPETWMQLTDHLRRTPGVEAASFAGWALLTGNRWTGAVTLPGREPEARPPYLLDVSPGFFDTMRIARLDGRDFRPGDVQPHVTGDKKPVTGVGIVNEAFARTYFNGQNPVGRAAILIAGGNVNAPFEIVGLVRDAAYGNLREPIRPTLYLPLAKRNSGSLLVRAAGDPLALVPTLRQSVSNFNASFLLRDAETQTGLTLSHLVRERLLATLSLFFAIVALVLAGVGLYGVLNYSVVQQRREIGIRMALGARPAHVARPVTVEAFSMVAVGATLGIAAGIACARFIEALLFEIKATDPSAVLAPITVLFATAVAAAVPPLVRAIRIDPAQTLRSE